MSKKQYVIYCYETITKQTLVEAESEEEAFKRGEEMDWEDVEDDHSFHREIFVEVHSNE